MKRDRKYMQQDLEQILKQSLIEIKNEVLDNDIYEGMPDIIKHNDIELTVTRIVNEARFYEYDNDIEETMTGRRFRKVSPVRARKNSALQDIVVSDKEHTESQIQFFKDIGVEIVKTSDWRRREWLRDSMKEIIYNRPLDSWENEDYIKNNRMTPKDIQDIDKTDVMLLADEKRFKSSRYQRLNVIYAEEFVICQALRGGLWEEDNAVRRNAQLQKTREVKITDTVIHREKSGLNQLYCEVKKPAVKNTAAPAVLPKNKLPQPGAVPYRKFKSADVPTKQAQKYSVTRKQMQRKTIEKIVEEEFDKFVRQREKRTGVQMRRFVPGKGMSK